ncbi:MAG: tetratricopeptide repeat protein, partial [Chthoniobacterales bacterium]
LEALNRNDLPAAETQLKAAAKVNPRDANVWLALAQTYLKLHKPEAANAAAEKAARLGSSDITTINALAYFYSETGDRKAAAAQFQKALQLKPYEETYYFELGRLYLQEQDFADALTTLKKGTRIFDKSAQLELALGVAYYGLRRFPEAIDAFLRTIQLAPEVEQPYVFLGKMLDQAESKLPAVIADFEAYRKTNPGNYLGPFLLAKALELQNAETALVESLLGESIRLNDKFPASHFELGSVRERAHDFSGAAEEYLRSIALAPNDPIPHYHLARVYDRLGKHAEAADERALHEKLAAGIK